MRKVSQHPVAMDAGLIGMCAPSCDVFVRVTHLRRYGSGVSMSVLLSSGCIVMVCVS